MRKTYHTILKNCFCKNLIQIRKSEGFTQVQMANMLLMDERSYIDLEHGKNGCSTVTLILFLIYVCRDVSGFLKELQDAFETAEIQIA